MTTIVTTNTTMAETNLGEGVPRDIITACMWRSIAEENGSEIASDTRLEVREWRYKRSAPISAFIPLLARTK